MMFINAAISVFFWVSVCIFFFTFECWSSWKQSLSWQGMKEIILCGLQPPLGWHSAGLHLQLTLETCSRSPLWCGLKANLLDSNPQFPHQPFILHSFGSRIRFHPAEKPVFNQVWCCLFVRPFCIYNHISWCLENSGFIARKALNSWGYTLYR